MPRLSLAILLLALSATPGLAQSWPSNSGIQQDPMRNAIDDFNRVRQYPSPRVEGEERREAITGVLGGAWAWVRGRADMVGEDDRDAQRYFNLRRQWEAELPRNR